MTMRRGISLRCAVSLTALAGALALMPGSIANAQEGVTGPTWAFDHPADPFKADAMLDLRYLNEKVAGESGFLKLSTDGNSFVLGNGKPVRFWAVVSDIYRAEPADMARQARFLAKQGVNMVRLHTQIAPTGNTSKVTDVNQKEIDGIWRCMAAMKKEGIYCTISPYWATGKDAAQWGIDGYDGKDGLWGLLFFNEKLQAGYKAWVKALYSPKNPYTGMSLASDPAVGIIQVQNEDGMFFWTMQGMKPAQQEKLGRKFGQWLIKKYGSLAKAKQAWEGAGNDKDDFAQGKVGMMNVYMLTQHPGGGMEKRLADETQFCAETQRTFYSEIAEYYRKDLGCKQLINASNWITADPIRLNDLERYTDTATDVIAVNKYTGGVHVGNNNGWRIDPGHHFTNSSCLTDPRALPTNLKQVAGHPMMITESTWVSPEGYQSEAPFLVAAYQSLTGVDGFYWFDTGSPEYDQNPYFDFLNFPGGQHAMTKWSCATPALIGGFPASALLYRMGYLKQGAVAVHEERPLQDLWQRTNPILAEDRTFDPNRDTGNARSKSELSKGVDPLAFLVGPVDVKYGGDAANDKVVDLAKYIDANKKTVKSITGEILLDYGNGLCTINAPKAQGVSGFLNKAGRVALTDLVIDSTNPYATVTAVSMDDKPLATSHKILIQVGTYVRPTGWQSKQAEFKSDDGKQTYQGYEVVNTGKMPWQVANARIKLTVKNTVIKKAVLLDTAGYAIKEVSGKSEAGAFTLTLPTNTLYLILK